MASSIVDLGFDKRKTKSAGGEDTALLASNPSADPGAKTQGRAARSVARLSPLGDGHQSDKYFMAQPRVLGVKTPGAVSRMYLTQNGRNSISR